MIGIGAAGVIGEPVWGGGTGASPRDHHDRRVDTSEGPPAAPPARDPAGSGLDPFLYGTPGAGSSPDDGAAVDPFLYGGALNIRINQDDTQELQNEQQIVTNPVDPDNLVAVWRDFRLGYRRVGYGASFDGGATWTEGLFEEPTWPWHSDPGLTVDDAEANGRDQFHPWLTIDESGAISVVFLDRRNDPSNYRYDLYMTGSEDGGLTWSENIRISDVSSDPNAGLVTAGLLGEYIGVTSSWGPAW